MSTYQVTNQLSGTSFATDRDESILDAAIKHGVNFPYGCKNGFCGQCKAVIETGEVAYDNDELPAGLDQDDHEHGVAFLCQCKAKSDVTLSVAEIDPALSAIQTKTLSCTVEAINKLNHDVAEVVLKTPSDNTLQYLAGQYIDIIYPEIGMRAFSIANAPHNSQHLELHIRLIEDGEFTQLVFNEMQPKAKLNIEGPKGSFYLRDKSENAILLVAGGTGFGPVKAMVEHAIEAQIDREIFIYWGVRDTQDLYSDLPKQWADAHENIHFVPVLSQSTGHWDGATGYVHEQVLADFETLVDYDVYACGPPQMVKSAANEFVKLGMNERNFFSDAFEFATKA